MSFPISLRPAAIGVFFTAVLFCFPSFGETPKLRVLVLSGANNHDWKKTTPGIVAALDETGRFEVDVEENVAGLKPTSFAAYDVILSNFNTFPKTDDPVWDAPTRAAFETHMKAGNGLVVVHAGSSIFYDWPFFQKLASATWGGGTSHGVIHSRMVSFTDAAHPVTAGLKPFWIHDEFWQNAQVAAGAKVLGTVTPLVAQNGTGKPESIIFATEIEGARGFTLLLGHQVDTMANAAWKTLLQRGTEWAATGSVTLPPAAKWPATEPEAAWENAPGQANNAVADLVAALRTYQPGSGRGLLISGARTIAAIATAGGAPQEQAAESLASLLSDSNGSQAAKKYVCEQLRLIGGAKQLAVLTKLLEDPVMAVSALRVIEAIPGEASIAVLREAAKREGMAGQANLAITRRTAPLGVIVPNPASRFTQPSEIVSGLRNPDPAIQDAASRAAMTAYSLPLATKASEIINDLSPVTKIRLLTLFAEHGAQNTIPAIEKLAADDPDLVVRAAALSTLGSISDQRSVALLVRDLDSTETAIKTAATEALGRLQGAPVDTAIINAIQKAPPKTQVAALGVLGMRSAVDQFAEILKFTTSPDQTIRRAAIQSLGEFAQAPQVNALLASIVKAPASDLPLWEKTLITASTLGDRKTAVEALAKTIENASADQLRILLPAINATGADRAREILIGKLKSPDESIRRTVVSSIGRSKSAAYLDALLAAAKEDSVPALRRLALRNVIEIAGDPAVNALTALQTLQSAADLAQNSDDRKAILAALSAVKSDGALQLIAKIASADPTVAPEATAATQKIGQIPATQ